MIEEKQSLKKFKGDQASGGALGNSKATVSIKLEPTFLAENEEALVEQGYIHQSRVNYYSTGGRSVRGGNMNVERGLKRGGQRGSHNIVERGSAGRSRGVRYHRDDRPMNLKGTNGRYLTCKACGSFRHMVTDCSNSWENISKTNIVQKDDLCKQEEYDINAVEEGERVTLFAGNNKRIIQELGNEAQNCAVLNCACSNTVCGQKWMNFHLQSLEPDDKSRVVCNPGRKALNLEEVKD